MKHETSISNNFYSRGWKCPKCGNFNNWNRSVCLHDGTGCPEMSDKERGDRLEAMVDRMSETIVKKDEEIFLLKERLANLEKMITRNA